jgi:hypothetical protein
MTLDELTMDIYNKMKLAFANGTVLTYAGELASKILHVAPVEEVREVVGIGARLPTPQPRSEMRRVGGITPPEPVLAPNARRNADGTERSDSVKTSRL